MKRNKLMGFVFLLLTVLLVSIPTDLKAATSDLDKLYDNADILTDGEEQELRASLDKMSKRNKMDIVILTTDSVGYQSRVDYGHDFITQNGFSSDFVILVINMDPSDRGLSVYINGKYKNYISNNRCDDIYNTIKSDMSAGYYYSACETYIDRVDYYRHHRYSWQRLGIEMLMALGIAGLITFIMIRNAGGKKTTDFNTYLDPTHSRLLAKRDRYLRTTVSKRKIERSSSSSGGSSGGSHGGNSGGGSF